MNSEAGADEGTLVRTAMLSYFHSQNDKNDAMQDHRLKQLFCSPVLLLYSTHYLLSSPPLTTCSPLLHSIPTIDSRFRYGRRWA